MKFTTNSINHFNGMIQIPIPKGLTDDVVQLQEYASKGKTLTIEIKRERRSRDANAALWHLINEMAIKLRITKEELYVELLKRYGVFTHIVIKEDALETMRAIWNGAIVVLGEIPMRNNVMGLQLQVYYGSSTYDSKQFARLLDGAISEAEEMGICLISASDRDLLIDGWSKRGEEVG